MTVHPAANPDEQTTAPLRPRCYGLVLGGCFALLGGLGWLDYLTGYELSFFVFYSGPIGLAAWYLGRWPGIGVAFGATVTWLLADFFGGAKYSHAYLYYWNSTIHFLAFIINAVTIAKIKSDLDRRHALAAELESTQAALRIAQARDRVCPSCGQSLTAGETKHAPSRAPGQ